VNKINEKISGLNKYNIRIIDSVKSERIEGMGVVCRHPGECDTLFLMFIDEG